jgi:hypothetical protein
VAATEWGEQAGVERRGQERACENSIVSTHKKENVWSVALLTSMYSLVFQGKSFGLPMVSLFSNCRLFQEIQILVA